MRFRIIPFQSGQREVWNRFVEDSNEGTIFHRLDFLAYHGNRFLHNEHNIVIYKGEAIYSVMPLAIFEEAGRLIVKSPYGGSYGGPVFTRPQNYEESHEILRTILEYLNSLRINEINITLPISVGYRHYCETFRLVLLEQGFQCLNRDISSVVCLNRVGSVSDGFASRARNMTRKAKNLDVTVTRKGSVEDFWGVLEKTFQKHCAKPTHTQEEFYWLCENMLERVYVDVAYLDGKPIAGIGHFIINERINSSFYLCQDPEYQQTQALSLLIQESLSVSQEEGFIWFDFGTSSLNQQGRNNIFRFKESFGAVGIFRETYKLELP